MYFVVYIRMVVIIFLVRSPPEKASIRTRTGTRVECAFREFKRANCDRGSFEKDRSKRSEGAGYWIGRPDGNSWLVIPQQKTCPQIFTSTYK